MSEGNAGKEEEEGGEGERGRGSGGRKGEREWEKAVVSLFSSGACSLRIFPQWSNATCVHTSVCEGTLSPHESVCTVIADPPSPPPER